MRVKERMPDEIVTKADQIVNIDLPAEDLQSASAPEKSTPKNGSRQPLPISSPKKISPASAK